MKKIGKNPNFTVMLPGPCNADCEFCTWERCENEAGNFPERLKCHLDELGDTVTQVSITGGEPTISPVFSDVMSVLRGYPDLKVVLTTNGANLKHKFDDIKGVVNHLNISRHHYLDRENELRFRSESVPGGYDLTLLCKMANESLTDVTLNRVVPNNYDNDFDMMRFTHLAKRVGASGICLRKDHRDGTLDRIPLEKRLPGKSYVESCPVCETRTYLIDGMWVYFKTVMEEPSEHVDYIFEFVLHPDGNLYEDWGMKKPIDLKNVPSDIFWHS
jgi:pyruvate-formate lyase-activating enzyme